MSWLRITAKTHKAKELKKYGQRWGITRVIGRDHKDELKAVIKVHWDAEPGSKAYLRHYQEGLKIVMGRRSPEELAAAEEKAKELNNALLPDDIRSR